MQDSRSPSAAPRRLGRLLAQLLQGSPSAAHPLEYEEPTEALEQYRKRLAQGPEAFKAPSGEAWMAYRDDAVKRAMELGNRGPMKFDADGNLTPEIQQAFWRCGFYVFENVISPEEVATAQAEVEERLDNAPVERESKVDKHGRPVKFPNSYSWVRSHLRDENGEDERGELIVGNLAQPMMTMESALRLYGHPDILRACACFNGPDFTPMYCNYFNKAPGRGMATHWHQDGRTHWDENGKPGRKPENGRPPRQPGAVYPEDLGCHGTSFHVALSKCVPEQCMWVLPFSHRDLFWPHWRSGKFEVGPGSKGAHLVTMDILNKTSEIELMPNAVPMLMNPGDVGVHNRNALHGSFPNMSPDRRLTLVCAFYNRRDVINQRARLPIQSKKEIERLTAAGKTIIRKKLVMDEDHIKDKTRIIQVAIDSRKEKYPNEAQYVYQPHVGEQMPPREAFVKEWVNSFALDI